MAYLALLLIRAAFFWLSRGFWIVTDGFYGDMTFDARVMAEASSSNSEAFDLVFSL